jgi:hypothetical protein
MAYRDQVTALAKERHITNESPTGLREEDLGIGGMRFYSDHNNSYVRIIGGKMNRAGRLFIEHHATVGDRKKRIITGEAFKALQALAPEYFAELWEDTDARPLLNALKHANSVQIYWKQRPTWLQDFNTGAVEKLTPDFLT